MMKYKDKLEMPIKLEKKKREEILIAISRINNEINGLKEKIENNEKEKRKNMEDLMNGKSDTSLFFGYQMDVYEKTEIENTIKLLEKQRLEWVLEQEKVKKKIEKMEEEREKRKKEFEKEKTKKEEKEIEELKMLSRETKEGQNEDNGYSEYWRNQ